MSASLVALASAVPTAVEQETLWEEVFAEAYGEVPIARRLWSRVAVKRRHGVVLPFKEDFREASTEERMRRFAEEAAPLGAEAVERGLERAGMEPAEVDLLAVATCTGYVTPGLDVLVADRLGMRPDLERLHIGHMGCYAAMPGMAAVSDAASARGKTGVLLCVELSSLHVQPPSDNLEAVVCHALFADAAGAAVFRPGEGGMRLARVEAWTDPSRAAHMTWDLTGRGFLMGLSPEVPSAAGEHAARVVDRLLEGRDRTLVDGWAIHPGGPRVLEAVGDALGLRPEQLATSHGVLRDFGNCSSATTLLILEHMLGSSERERVVALGFGPGLTVYGALLERSG